MTVKIAQKIKGYAVRQPSDQSAAPAAPAAQTHFTDDADRRLKIVGTPVPPTASLRWQKRPELKEGNPSYTYTVDSPEGRFAVIVGHVPNGSPSTGSPFEVWVVGDEMPRGLGPLARSLSIDMRSLDRAWLAKKLDALMKCEGESFEMDLPDGRRVRVGSAVAAFATLVKFRCEQLGAFSDEKLAETPVIDALMSKREPKTTANGSIGWYADVHNYATGDDFVLLLKEATLENGQNRPFSVFLSGNYPRSLDGLCKSLSLDARVAEPGWIARKLQQLEDAHEELGSFMAPIPGNADRKQKSYPSTVAYVAAVIQNRFRMLGLFDEQGQAATDSGVISLDAVRQQRGETIAASKVSSKGAGGTDCASCSSVGTVLMLDGCQTCVSCCASKCS